MRRAAPRRRDRSRLLLALLGCLPAATAQAKVDYAPDWMFLGRSNALTFTTAIATVAGALLGWRLAHPDLRQPGFLRTWRGRWTLLLGAAICVASWRLWTVMLAAPGDWAAFAAYTLLQCGTAITAALLIGHAAGLARRSPRWWRLTEAGALLAVAGIATALGWNLGEGGWMIARITIGLVVLSLLAASIAALRAEAALASMTHRRALVIGLAATLVIATLVGTRLRTMGPRGLNRDEVTAAPAGSWVSVWGSTTWPLPFEPGYLLDVQSGRWLRLGVTRSEGCWFEPAIAGFSANGRVAAWLPTSDDTQRPRAVFVADLSSPSPQPRRLDCVQRDAWGDFVMSPSGRWLLIRADGHDVLVDVAADRIAARFEKLEGWGQRISRLDDSGHLDVALASVDRGDRPLGCVEIYAADIADPSLRLRSAAEPPRFPSPPKVGWMRFVGASRILIAWSGERNRATLALHDASNGALVAIIAESGTGSRRDHVMSLSDGRLVRIALRDSFMSLAVYSADGALERSIPLASSAASLTLAGEHSPGRFVVGVRDQRESCVVVVDVNTGDTVSSIRGLASIDHVQDAEGAVCGPATRLFRETSEIDASPDALIALDWTTGARRVVLPH